MQKKQISHASTSLTYYQKGNSPTLLLHAGLHGDEYSIIPIVERMVKKYEDQLLDFIFVPVVSPSAVTLQTRKNGNGLDLNRSFLENAADLEVLVNKELVQPFNFNLLVSFHEDTELDGFYIYDSKYAENRDSILSFCQQLKSSGVEIFTGVDDKEDPVHGYTVVNGHVIWGIDWDEPLNGTFDDWAIKNKIVDRLLMPEIPTNFSLVTKEKVLESIFTELILPTNSTLDILK